jgi:ABC-2 type transport system permease protein
MSPHADGTAGLALRRVAIEQKTFWRNREAAFFTILLPIALLLILGQLNHGNTLRATGQRFDLGLVPGVLGFGLIATCYINLANTLTKLREDGILKRLRATPLSPSTYLAGQIGSTMVTCALLTAVVVTAGAVAYDARLSADAAIAFAVTVLLGAVCFGALGFAITIAVKTFAAVSPVTNATSLPLVLISGAFSPNEFYAHSSVSTIAGVFPVQRFAHALQTAYLDPAAAFTWTDWSVLLAWAMAAAVVAHRRFRWTPTA